MGIFSAFFEATRNWLFAIASSPAMIAYNVAKAVQKRLTICLAEELKGDSIAVNG
jgi:NAD(P)-dependent dehydrogenase (short-subunit alcohol dehydrogenase family)